MENIINEPSGTHLINQRELADLLGCNPRTISNLLRRRKIPVVKVGTLNRFQPERVIEALSEASPKGGVK
jgi:excisionase family DNA binding protein